MAAWHEKAILLVEDNPDDAELTLRALRKSNVVNEIVVASDGVEALELLHGTGAGGPPDLERLPVVVLLDLNLPRIDGLEVLRRIRSHPHTRLLPVVVLTSSREDQDILSSYSSGANSYVRKPVESAAFTQAVHQLGLYWLVLNEGPRPERGPR